MNLQVIDTRRINHPVQEGQPFAPVLTELARLVGVAEVEGFRLKGTSLGVIEMVRVVESEDPGDDPS